MSKVIICGKEEEAIIYPNPGKSKVPLEDMEPDQKEAMKDMLLKTETKITKKKVKKK